MIWLKFEPRYLIKSLIWWNIIFEPKYLIGPFIWFKKSSLNRPKYYTLSLTQIIMEILTRWGGLTGWLRFIVKMWPVWMLPVLFTFFLNDPEWRAHSPNKFSSSMVARCPRQSVWKVITVCIRRFLFIHNKMKSASSLFFQDFVETVSGGLQD